MRQIPEMNKNGTGMAKVHFTIPILLKKKDKRGLIAKLLKIKPKMVETMRDGIKDRAVWMTSCFVVKPRAFSIP